MGHRKSIIIIRRNGETRVYTGWRAWLAGTGFSLLVMAAMAVAVAMMAGTALTVALFVLLGLPLAIAAGFVWAWLQNARRR